MAHDPRVMDAETALRTGKVQVGLADAGGDDLDAEFFFLERSQGDVLEGPAAGFVGGVGDDAPGRGGLCSGCHWG